MTTKAKVQYRICYQKGEMGGTRFVMAVDEEEARAEFNRQEPGATITLCETEADREFKFIHLGRKR